MEAVRGFKVKIDFPLNLCEGTQRGNLCEGTQQGTSDKFDGDQLCYGLSDLDLMIVDVHQICVEKLNERVPKSLMDICFIMACQI